MDIINFIDNKLSKYRNSTGNLSEVDNDFIFAYGPYMCMKSGEYEHECDEIAKHNKYMQIMVHAAYLIRKIHINGVSYSDAKEIIKKFIISVDNAFTESDNIEKEVLNNFAINYLSNIRKEQKLRGDLESFITTASPIIPYNQTIAKPEIESAEETSHMDISNRVRSSITKDIESTIVKLLYGNLSEIMMNYSCSIILCDESDNKINLLRLDKLIKRNDEVSLDCQKYYFLAMINYYNLQNDATLDRYLDFFSSAGDFSKTKNYTTFESMINTMANSTDIDICTESWDDPTLDSKEEEAISNIIQSHTSYINEKTSEVKYDFGVLNDFINVKRYMKFEEFPNRLFMGSLEKSRIINVNNMGIDRNYYEMDNNTVACPFIDLRTYDVRVIVLHANTNEIEIIDDIKELY